MPHQVHVKLKSIEKVLQFDASFSGIIDNPDRLWIERPDGGSRIYFMLSEVIWYVLGEDVVYEEKRNQ